MNCETLYEMGLIYSHASDYAIDKLYSIFTKDHRNFLSKLRYEYKLKTDSESVATGELREWLKADLASWVGLVPDELIPQGLAYNTLPISWWEDKINELKKITETLE